MAAAPPGGNNAERLRASATQPRTRLQCCTWGAGGTEGKRPPPLPWPHTPLPGPGVLTSCSSPFRRCSYSRIRLNCFKAVSTLQPQPPRASGPFLKPASPAHLGSPKPAGPPARLPPQHSGSAPLGLHLEPGSSLLFPPLPQEAPPLLLRRAFQTLGVALPACPAREPAGNSPSAPTPRSAASALLPWRGKPLGGGVRAESEGLPPPRPSPTKASGVRARSDHALCRSRPPP